MHRGLRLGSLAVSALSWEALDKEWTRMRTWASPPARGYDSRACGSASTVSRVSGF